MLTMSRRLAAKVVLSPRACSTAVVSVPFPSSTLARTTLCATRLYMSNANSQRLRDDPVRRYRAGMNMGQHFNGSPSESEAPEALLRFRLGDDQNAWVFASNADRPSGGDVVLFHLDNKQSLVLNRHALRDSCECDKCVDPHSGQKNFGTTEVPDELSIRSYRRMEDASLEIVWDNDFLSPGANHTSVYSPSMIRGWFNKAREGLPRRPTLTIWDRELFEASSPMATYDDWMSGGSGFHNALAQLWNYGLVIIDGVPKSEESVVTVANQIGHVMETFYGRTWDVRSKPQAENVAYTNTFLGLHQDLLYTRDPPRIQLLHCLENTCEGGDSIFSDSQRAAKLMQLGPEKLFRALLSKRLRYHYKKDGHYYERMRPILQSNGDIVWWSPPFQSPKQDVAQSFAGSKEHATWLKAAKIFRQLLEDDRWLFEYKLKPGQCVIFDNLRVLHGRRKFDTSSGNRWFKGTYISGDEWNSKTSTLSSEITAASRVGTRFPAIQARHLASLHRVWPFRNEAIQPPEDEDATRSTIERIKTLRDSSHSL